MNPAPSVELTKVEWRVDSDNYDGRCRWVPYIDARDVADLLDEWVGPAGWRDKYEQGQLAGEEVLWCHLSVWNPDIEQWVTKSDVGKAGNFEKAKSLVSDAFKRAGCVKWGCGRNVYSLPNVWAPCDVTPKGKPKANVNTLPAILDELRRRGFQAEGGRVREAEPEGDESPVGAGPGPTGDPAMCGRCGEPLAGAAVKRVGGQNFHRDCVEA